MIEYRCIRIFVCAHQEAVPEGYTWRTGLLGLLGLKGSNIHIHLGDGWDKADEEKAIERLQQMAINLSMNPSLPLITVGKFDKRIHPMLLAMEALQQ